MERLGCTLAKAPLFYGWHAIATWSRHLPQESAVWRARHPHEAAFCSPYGRATIAADTFDAVLNAAAVVIKAFGVTPRAPKPYPRPTDRPDTRHFGSGGIPVSEFDAWYYAQE